MCWAENETLLAKTTNESICAGLRAVYRYIDQTQIGTIKSKFEINPTWGSKLLRQGVRVSATIRVSARAGVR